MASYIFVSLTLIIVTSISASAQSSRFRAQARVKTPILKDTFYEDNRAVVRIKTTYNATTSVSCNGVVMDSPNLVLSDVSCIKYQGMANIDAKYVQVVSGEQGQEEYYEVDQIYINKANPNDPSTELALLKLKRQISVESPCVETKPPQLVNNTLLPDLKVRVVGYTQTFELKENRTRISKRIPLGSDKYICTQPSDSNETPGYFLMKGAPLLAPVDCRTYHLIGILTRVDTYMEGGKTRQQDCFVMVSSQLRWYGQVRTLASLTSKNDAVRSKPSVIVVAVDD